MSELQPIGDFAKTFAQIELGLYLAKLPPAVLMLDVAKATFPSTAGREGDTVEVLLQADKDARESGETNLNEIPRKDAYLVVTLSSSARPESTRLLLGASAACDIIIPDESVSRKHAWIERNKDDYTIEDNSSKNGTWLGDDALIPGQPYRLSPGDLIAFGSTDLIFLDPAAFYHFTRRFLGV